MSYIRGGLSFNDLFYKSDLSEYELYKYLDYSSMTPIILPEVRNNIIKSWYINDYIKKGDIHNAIKLLLEDRFKYPRLKCEEDAYYAFRHT